jgi:hypothetical protein
MRWIVIVVATGQLLLISNTAVAQKDSTAPSPLDRHATHAWIIPLGIAVSAAIDPEMREWTLHRHSRSLDRFAKYVNPLGTASHLVPAMALTYLGALVTHHQSLATGTLTAAGGGLVGVVAWDRVYEDQHWTSDVTATAALSSIVSRATIHWIDSHLRHLPNGDIPAP